MGRFFCTIIRMSSSVAAVVVFVFLPARAVDREPISGALDGLASATFAEAEGALQEAELQDAELENGDEAGALVDIDELAAR